MAFIVRRLAEVAIVSGARLIAGACDAGLSVFALRKPADEEVFVMTTSTPRLLWRPRLQSNGATVAPAVSDTASSGGSSCTAPCSSVSAAGSSDNSVSSDAYANASPNSPADPFSGFTLLSVGKKLGMGAFGEVFAVEIQMDDGSTREAVMKVQRDPSKVAAQEREVAALEAVRGCPYVVQMYGSGWRDGRFCIVMERARGVPLNTLLDEACKARGYRSRTVLPYPQIARLARQLLTAVEAMGARGLLHGDLKPANIMYDQVTGDITIVDLGCACWQRPDGLDHVAGTQGYMSREMEATIFRNECEYRPCLQSDVASVGCILTAATAFADDLGLILAVRDYELELPSYAPRDLQQLIYGCLEENPQLRLTPSAALAEPFLARFPGS